MDSNDSRIEQFFIRGSHHHNSSVFFVVQNLFNQGGGHGNCSLNAHYVPRTLNAAERDYSMGEKQALACVFGVYQMHQYVLMNFESNEIRIGDRSHV